MKMNNETYEDLKYLITRQIEMAGLENVKKHLVSLKGDKRVKDIKKRFCFDLLYAIPQTDRITIIDSIYESGCHDDHIFTALKHIVKDYNLF